MFMATGIVALAFVIAIAAFFAIIAKMLRQPILLAYLATGAVVGYFGILNFAGEGIFGTLSELGIMFLLFLVGLEINYTSLRLVGRAALAIGILQVTCTSFFGFLIGYFLFGFGVVASLYIAIALTFSSTIIVVKLISDKKDMGSLYAKIAVGMLLVQDFVAILLLILLPGIASAESLAWGVAIRTTLEGIVLLAAMVLLGRNVLPRLFDRVADSREVLFLVSLAWLFIIAAGLRAIGLSVEIGGFLAGLALANSSERFQIESRVRPLRDFFMLVFFAILGASLVTADFRGLGLPILAFSAFVLIGNPFIVFTVMSAMGYKKRTSFFTGITVGQISEFSLILVALGARLGHISAGIASLVTAVGIVSIVVSSYIITHGENIFRRVRWMLRFFERTNASEHNSPNEDVRKPIVIIGGHRTGQSIAQSLEKDQILMIDFDPEIIHHFEAQGIPCLFGDIADPDIFEKAHIEDAKLVISTSPHFEDNMTVVAAAEHLLRRPKVVVRAEDENEAAVLYAHGADYVMVPHVTSGHYLGKTIAVDSNMNILKQLRERDRKMMASPIFMFKK